MGDMLLKQVTGVRRAQLDDRLLAGIVARASEKLAKVNVAIQDVGDIPEGKGKTTDSYFYTPQYEKLLDERKALLGLIEKLRTTRTGAKPEKTPRLSRRPLTPREEADQAIEKLRSTNPREEIEREIGRMRAKQKIIRSAP